MEAEVGKTQLEMGVGWCANVDLMQKTRTGSRIEKTWK
jgi:hypothetical protein